MTRRVYRAKWNRLRDRYEKLALKEFRRSIKKAVNEIPFERLEKHSYVPLIDFYISQETITQTYFDFYERIGIAHGKKTGTQINKETKNFEPSTFEIVYRDFLRQWLLENAGTRITSVRQSVADYLIEIIAKGVGEGKDVSTIAREMRKLVNSRSFYGWQALRIARTETTAAANLGALIAGRESNLVMEKEWISTIDPRTRRLEKGDDYDHWRLDGVVVDEDGLFEDNGSFLRFPGDPTAPAGAVINCRCAMVMLSKRDEEGRLIFRS